MRTEIIQIGKGHIVVYNDDDVEATIERNKVLRGLPQKSDWGRHVACIPNIILVQWFNEARKRGNTRLRMFTPEFDAIIARKLEDPEWKYLRTDK